jgi:hypothetical protein
MRIKKIFTCVIAFLTVASMFTACGKEDESSSKSSAGNSSETTTAADSAAETTLASTTTEALNPASLSFSEIEDIQSETDIVQIFGLNSDVETPGVNTFNNIITNGILMQYNEFLNNRTERDWIEIHSYKSLDENYVQILYNKNIFPTYAQQGEIFSVNYDIKTDNVLTIEEAIEMAANFPDGVINAETMAEYVKTVYPTTEEWASKWGEDISGGKMYIDSTEVTAFMLPCNETDMHLRFYLTATYKDSNGDTSYTYQDLLVYDTTSAEITAYSDGNGF